LGDPRPSEIELELGRGGRKGLFQQERMLYHGLLQHYREPLVQYALDILMNERPDANVQRYTLSQSHQFASPGTSNHGVYTTPTGDHKNNKRQQSPDRTDEVTARLNKQAKKTGVYTAKRPSIQALRLACPYFKHDPIKFGKRGACSGPGWESVHRLK
jgi:hypothetical protein